MSLDDPAAVHWTLSACAKTLAASLRIPSADRSVGNSLRNTDAVDVGVEVVAIESGICGGRGPVKCVCVRETGKDIYEKYNIICYGCPRAKLK